MMNPQDAQQFQQAVAMAQAGQTQQANAILVQLTERYPNDVNLLLWLAQTSSDLNQANYYISRAEMLQPGNPAIAQAKSWLASQYPAAQAYNPPPANPGYQPQNNYYQPNPGYQQPQPNYMRQKLSWFERFGLGWAFMKQAFTMAGKDKNLLKPSFYSLGVNVVASIIMFIPLVIVYAATKQNQTVLYVSLFLVAVVNYFITYFFSAMTISLVYQFLTTGRTDWNAAWAASKGKTGPILTVAAISAFITTLRRFIWNNERGIWGIVAGIITSIIESIWTAYTYFILPVIMIEHLDVGAAVKRSTAIIKNNLLQIGVGYVGLSLVTGLLGFGFFLMALLLSVVIFVALVKLSAIVAFILAILLFVAAVAIMSAFTSYLRIAYYTCLVVWARDVERLGYTAPAPMPLQTVLNGRAA